MASSDGEDDFMQDMEKLRELDPEFYEYLQENDKQLLDFKTADDVNEAEADIDEASDKVQVLTRDKLDAMTTLASQGKCFKTLRGILAAYRVAARMSSGSQESSKVRIDDVSVFNALLEWVLANVPSLIEHHAGSRRKGEPISACAKWHRVKHVAHQFWGESLFIIQQLTAAETLEHVLVNLCSAVELLTPLPKLKPLVLKQVSLKWATTDADGVRVSSSALLIKYAQTIISEQKTKPEKTQVLEGVLKRMVYDYSVQIERNPGRVATNEYMAGVIGDIISLDEDAGFRVVVSSVRQLATVLSTAMNDNKKGSSSHEAFTLSFVRSVQVWVRVIGRFASLSSMVFPISSIITIACKAKESHSIYLPYLSLMAVEANVLMESSSKFIPIAATLMKALTIPSKRYHETKGTSSAKFPNVDTCAKLQESQLKDNKPLLSALIQSIVKRLAEHMELIARTPAFKEVSYPVLVHLRKIIKQYPAVKNYIRPLIIACEESAELCCKARASLRELPSELFSVPGASIPIKKLLSDGIAPQKPLANLIATGKGRVMKTEDIKQAAAVVDSLSKRALKRRRQKEKMIQQRAAKKVRKSDKLTGELMPMVLSDDE